MVDGPSLNNIIDQAFALDGIIGSQDSLTSIDPVNDQVLVLDADGTPSPTRLRRAKVNTLPSGVTTLSATATPPSVFNISVTNASTTPAISLSLDSQGPGTVLAGPISGSAATPAFRVLAPSDLPSATVNLSTGAIDWSLGNCFKKTLPASGSATFTFSNPTEGQTIVILMAQGGTCVTHFPAGVSGVYWPGGTEYVPTTGAGKHDVVILRYIGSNYWGNYYLNFLSV